MSFSLLLAISGEQSLAADSSKRILMGAMGDSISAASLADVPIPSTGEPHDRVREWAEQGVDARFVFENKRLLSWASGREIESHYVRLRSWLPSVGDLRPLDVLNASFPFKKAAAMPGQARQIVEAMKTGAYAELKYVTILIGANDVCSDETPTGTPLESMRQDLMTAFRTLSEVSQAEPIRILLVGMPKIPNLATPEFRSAQTLFGLSCETVRDKILHACGPLLSWRSPEQYLEKTQIVENGNNLLRQVAQEASAQFRNLDIAYSNAITGAEIPIELLAADCFHPAKSGQGVIADRTWRDQPWFK